MPSGLLGDPNKVVLDTNNIISAQINKKGISCKIFRLFLQGRIKLFTSSFQIAELKKVLNYTRIKKKYGLTPKRIKKIIFLIEKNAVKVYPSKVPSIITDDLDDNYILAIALEKEVDFIVSGDKHLLGLKKFKNIPIISAKDFLKVRKMKK